MTTSVGVRPTVLVVDDDAAVRRLVRTGLELEGLHVLEAGSLAQARAVLGESVDGVVLDRQLSDGDGLSLVPELVDRWAHVRIVVHSSLTGAAEDTGLPTAVKGDVEGIAEALGLTVHQEAGPCPAVRVTRERSEALKQQWAELCRWDPALPPDAEPILAESMVQALGAAFERPQPLGWGLDPALESAAEAFAVNAGSIDIALAQLVCLHETFSRQVIATIDLAEREEARRRLDMIVHRTMVVAGQISVRRLLQETLTDPLTGIRNRRAFELDLEREVARARRHTRPLTLAMLDVDNLKAINDAGGHQAGDDALRAMAGALGGTARQEDGAYRIGGDEFALILVDAERPEVAQVVDRLRDGGAPAFSVGLASLPEDPPELLMRRADERLYELRRRRRQAMAAPGS